MMYLVDISFFSSYIIISKVCLGHGNTYVYCTRIELNYQLKNSSRSNTSSNRIALFCFVFLRRQETREQNSRTLSNVKDAKNVLMKSRDEIGAEKAMELMTGLKKQ